MKYYKLVIGIILIIGAIAGLIYWEFAGRERVLTDELLVAKENILPGTEVSRESFKVIGVMEDNVVEGALGPDQIHQIEGKIAAHPIAKNSQIVHEYFYQNDFLIPKGQSIFVIKPEWISMRSSSLRRGDWINIYEDISCTFIGAYRIAFVKDSNEVEVKSGGGLVEPSLLDRIDSTSVISHVEIIASFDEYHKILEKIYSPNHAKLILVQKEEAFS